MGMEVMCGSVQLCADWAGWQWGVGGTAQVTLKQQTGDIRHSLGETSERDTWNRKKAEIWAKALISFFFFFKEKLFGDQETSPKRGRAAVLPFGMWSN